MKFPGVRASLGGFAIAALLSGSFFASSAGASSAPSGWSVVPLPASPTYAAPDDTITVAADGLGNIYYVPSGGCQYAPMLRSRSAHLVRALTVRPLGQLLLPGPGCGIERYNPTTGALTQLAPTTWFGFAYDVTVDPAGNVFVLQYDGTIYEITANGALSTYSTAFASSNTAVGIAVNAADQVFVTSVLNGVSTVSEIPYAGATPTSLATVSDVLSSIAVAPDGTLYTTSYNGNDLVYRLSVGGNTLTPIGTGWSYPETVAVDAAGNVYVADEYNHVVTEITPSGGQTNLPTVPTLNNATSYPDEIFYGGGTVYLWDEATGSSNVLYAWNVTVGHAINLLATASVAHVGATVTQTVTATWTGGAPAYRCTLLYGYNNPSTFTVTTTSPTCSFTNLTLGVAWGVSVVALNNGVASAPSVTFAAPASFTITCTYRGHVLHRTGTDPRCPLRWIQHV